MGRNFTANRIVARAMPWECAEVESAAEPLTLLACAGPYTTTDDLLYAPLTELLRAASRRACDLLSRAFSLAMHGIFCLPLSYLTGDQHVDTFAPSRRVVGVPQRLS